MVKYTKEDLKKIGRNLAETYGAKLVVLETRKDNSVTFLLDKDEERFTITLQPCELKEYNH